MYHVWYPVALLTQVYLSSSEYELYQGIKSCRASLGHPWICWPKLRTTPVADLPIIFDQMAKLRTNYGQAKNPKNSASSSGQAQRLKRDVAVSGSPSLPGPLSPLWEPCWNSLGGLPWGTLQHFRFWHTLWWRVQVFLKNAAMSCVVPSASEMPTVATMTQLSHQLWQP